MEVEGNFWSNLKGDLGVKAVQSRLTGCFPTSTAAKTVEQCLGELEVLKKSEVFSFVGLGMAAQYQTIQTWLMSMKSGRSPTFGSIGDDTFLATVKTKFAFFARHLEGASASSATAVTCGKQVVEAKLQEVIAKVATHALGLADVRPLHIFQWLLNTQQQQR